MIVNNIAKIREEKGLTIRQLEYKTGISKSTLSRIENNQARLYLDSLEKISNKEQHKTLLLISVILSKIESKK